MGKRLALQHHGIEASRLVLGCMGLGGGWDREPVTQAHVKQAHEAVEAALSAGINMFDHADIYTLGKAEEVFGRVLKERPGMREEIILQSKCGIRFEEGPGRPGRYDFSKEHILSSVDGILQRLGTEYLDILLLHRPDPLMEPEEVAEAFVQLKRSGKVKGFGVSNMSGGQMRFLQSALDEPLLVNQLELNLAKLDWVDAGVHVNQAAGTGVSFPDGTLEYCRSEKVQVQAWGPLARGLFTGRDLAGESDAVRATAALVAELAEARGVPREAVVLAWLMRHPAGIQPVLGTVKPQRIADCAEALKVELTREEWYSLYVSSRGERLP
ncbi:aldo/keto reductase [Paenibacillus mucilaginosus]|uniref:Aldo/keto reductase n=1 Tax=Paenibacillus mucilaginosus (strain KNP414) TaxID=1036673 RepID=F8FDH6_PAEMK|nr:aldo/keto reductase [Paenibacillus mucilaginosus]AEI42146.1 aldo/keto reductase [Paenibacillus mucilaginosus KNP414]MCG7214123.1 aldo/keto reductase [Paenibacillus mucilaginosus]WDM28643.1 aldo/keto reductase [Paenibacillus mucilaginosus]